MFNDLPIFGVCGWSGSGKTTLIENVLPLLLERGLSIVVVKHDVHGITTETSGKDSERIFRAGADVIVNGPDQALARRHGRGKLLPETQLSLLAEQYDLILVEGYKSAQWPKVWLTKYDESTPPQDAGNPEAVLSWDTDRPKALAAILDDFLQKIMIRTHICGCLLIGGNSTRMGTPKHLLSCADCSPQTWLHHTVNLLEQVCHRVVLVGDGSVPADLQHLPRLVDAPEIKGPMAGLLAAMRWAPRASWLLTACDMPCLSADALKWLVAQRRPGVWAVLPCLDGGQHIEPLLAYYDFRCIRIFEQLAMAGTYSLQDAALHPKALRVTVPAVFSAAWTDVDTPESFTDYTNAIARDSNIKRM